MTTKTCTRCRVEQPATDAYFHHRYAGGRRLVQLDSWCRACRREIRTRYGIANDALLKMKGKQKREALRLRGLVHYSGSPPACACCGEKELLFLVLDHINGGGREHRQHINKRGISFYSWLEAQGWPDGYRVLCHNCNAVLGCYGWYPHQGEGGANHGRGHLS